MASTVLCFFSLFQYYFSSNDSSAANGMHKLLILLVVVNFTYSKQIFNKYINDEDKEASNSDLHGYKYINPIGPHSFEVKKYPVAYKKKQQDDLPVDNPLLSALLLSTDLHLKPKNQPPNHPDLPPINPFLALLLSQYGRYLPVYGPGRGIYAYQASNDFHNNKPFGSYKIYEDGE